MDKRGVNTKLDKKRLIVLIAFFVVILIVISFIFSKFIYAKVCKDEECFSDSLAECERATFTKEIEDASWYYKIKGTGIEGQCIVYVMLEKIKKGDVKILSLEGKDMHCLLPYSVVETPQRDIERCHGDLKEEIQSILIKKMHSYLLENIGQVSEEFEKVI